MVPNRANYQRLPRTSSDLEQDGRSPEFKDKPLRRRRDVCVSFRKSRRCLPRVCRLYYLLALLLSSLILQLLFNGSYLSRSAPKFQINTEEKVFIAANIIDADLVTGAWGRSLLELVERIGRGKVFVSIYGGPTLALTQFAQNLPCDHMVVSEQLEPLDIDMFPRILLPSGEKRIKRIAYLAALRNKVLEPLIALKQKQQTFQRVLFLNDVYFHADEALRLIWGTNVNSQGRAEYKAACAADFVQSWKYYDTFATRDSEGYSLGIPIFPWFSASGDAASRRDVLAGRDAVRVKSCWGGMVSFDARYFTSTSTSVAVADEKKVALPLRFRAEAEPFWDSSECCLVHSDIMALTSFSTSSATAGKDRYDTGIFMNPYVRTAYSAQTLAWIPFVKRFERLLAPIQWFFTPQFDLPRFNYRRTETPGQVVQDRMWVNSPLNHSTTTDWRDLGYYQDVTRVAHRGGYCGVRQLLVLKEDAFPDAHNGFGGANWDNLLDSVPPL